MRKLGVKTSKYANTELYTLNPIDDEGNGTITMEGLKYAFESGFQFYKLEVPKFWTNPTGEFEKFIRDFLTAENRIKSWEEAEAYFKTCVPDDDYTEEDDQELHDELYARFGM